jgi:hypothetical protein
MKKREKKYERNNPCQKYQNQYNSGNASSRCFFFSCHPALPQKDKLGRFHQSNPSKLYNRALAESSYLAA